MDAAETFIARQLAREPGLRLLPVFLPPAQRGWLPAWVALLGELDEAMFEVSDSRVAQTKLAWWGNDLAAGGRAQHPLSRRLFGHPAAAAVAAADWRGLAGSALALAMIEHAPADWEDARQRWEALAGQVAAIEAQLCGRPVAAAAVREAWQLQRAWSALRQRRMERSVAPLPLQAPALLDYPVHPLWEALAQQCDGFLAAADAPSLHRDLLQAVWRWRLARLRRGRPPEQAAEPGALRWLWQSWRRARRQAPR
jgi:hypothetical protein